MLGSSIQIAKGKSFDYISFVEATLPAGTVVYAGRDNAGDLTLNALTGKTVNFAIAGTDKARVDGSGLMADIVAELVAAAGVTIDGVLLKDSMLLGTITIPAATDTLCLLAATQTLSAKTFATPIIASLYQASGGGLLTVPASVGVDTVCLLAATQELDGKTLDTAVGKGTWTASGIWTLPAVTLGGAVTISGLTASEILGTDVSKNLVSLAVATYPSLTELSYVKGLSSAIQTQLGLKAPLASPTFSGTVTLPSTVTVGAAVLTFPGVTGTFATLAGSEELDNKTLDSAVAKGTWTGSAWVTPAHTMGGNISTGGKKFDAGSENAIITTTGGNRGLQIIGTYNPGTANVGPHLAYLYNRGGAGAIANLDGDFFIYSFLGYNDNATPEMIVFARQFIVIDDASDTTEDAHWEWYAQLAGAENEAMDLTGAGLLWLDVGVNVDDYYQVAGTQVVSAQGAAVADATDAATAITQLNAWLARARTHGLIAAA